MQPALASPFPADVVISFQFSTFVSLMQQDRASLVGASVVISFQFSTFVSLMQLDQVNNLRLNSCD